jgi:acyl carrier protein
MTTIEKTVIRCAAEAYGVDAATITLDTLIRENLSKKSLLLIAFISAIEDELDVKIDLLDAAKLYTIRDFIEKVNQLAA